MSATILLTTAITGILILVAISIIELIEKRGSLSKMETRIRAMNRKIWCSKCGAKQRFNMTED